MSTFLIDDDQALCRYLAARTWTKDFVTQSERDINEKMKKQKAEKVTSGLMDSLSTINANRCKTGQDNPAKRKRMLPDNFSKTVVYVQ